MDISIVVVAYNEEKNITACLQSLVDQHFPLGRLEIIIVDGMSADRTVEYANRIAKHHAHVRIILNSGRTIASNRNVGWRNAAYPFVAYTDADCICPPNWIHTLANAYQTLKDREPDICAVGGGNTTDGQFGKLSEAIAIAFDTTLSALGSVQTRLYKNYKSVASIACLNALYEKQALLRIDGFDESLKNMGEDWDVNFRIRASGGKLYYVPGAEVNHRMRTNAVEFCKQMYRYGKGRGKLIRKNMKTLHWMYIIPLLFILILACSLLIYFVTQQPGWLTPLLYFPMMMLYSIIICAKKNKLHLFLHVLFVFYTVHFAYSFGEWVGISIK